MDFPGDGTYDFGNGWLNWRTHFSILFYFRGRIDQNDPVGVCLQYLPISYLLTYFSIFFTFRGRIDQHDSVGMRPQSSRVQPYSRRSCRFGRNGNGSCKNNMTNFVMTLSPSLTKTGHESLYLSLSLSICLSPLGWQRLYRNPFIFVYLFLSPRLTKMVQECSTSLKSF